ncbi:MAG: SET domain-containing protein [Hydrococcus sp. C42_A2020_068]|uniref:SET domain-containing protein n=1 Tax=Pleurocapsa sp. PCC 7327 TaxID=118163 RepID=UPI00029F9DF5|nr:SET domain-containing protein [Pleurocapsa sp. PCC 7327]AFY76446.1 SET domain-containing protein [Pleurocapsa sp. PCC 7327]MBF2018753.1 SET domain-containing protein [Hydrococcus sp. C42_A2020_068]
MMHPHTCLGFVNEEIGYGVFATQFIPKGTIVWVLDDLDYKLDEAYVKSLDPLRQKQVRKYTFRDSEGKYILCWDIGRFVNHSFNANCIATAYDFEIAVRDIHPGEELRDDYGCLNLDKSFDFPPEEGVLRTKVTPDDLLHYHQEWDRLVLEAMPYFNKVEQPLKHLIDKKYIDKVNAVAEGRESLDSVLVTYYDRYKKLNLSLN